MSSFATGLIVGQLSVLIVGALLLKFFLFAESPGVKGVSLPDNRSVDVQPETPASLNMILEHIYYNVDTHQSESMDWFTLLVALNINALREQAVFNNHMLKMLNEVFTSDKIPKFIDTIKVTELNLGQDYPLFNNCKVFRSSDRQFSDGLEARFDIDLKDKITLGIETRILLNYPKAMVAYLPVKASVSLVNFSGRASVSMISSKAASSESSEVDTEKEFAITISFAPDFSMEFRVSSLVGARSQLQDVPKLGQVVESAIRSKFAERMVSPNFVRIPLPSLWRKEKSELVASAAQAGETMANVTEKAAPADCLALKT